MKVFLFIIILLAIPIIAFGQQGINCGDATSTTLCNPVRYPVSDLGTFGFYLVAGFTSFFALNAVIMVVFSGFRMIISQGDSEALSSAKSSLTWAILGLVLSLFAFALIYATGEFIGAKNLNPDSYVGDNLVRNPLLDDSFLQLIGRLLEGFLSIVGILAIFMIVIGGFRYITSSGNEEQAESGKKTLQWAIIGLVTTLLAYVLVRATLTFFGG